MSCLLMQWKFGHVMLDFWHWNLERLEHWTNLTGMFILFLFLQNYIYSFWIYCLLNLYSNVDNPSFMTWFAIAYKLWWWQNLRTWTWTSLFIINQFNLCFFFYSCHFFLVFFVSFCDGVAVSMIFSFLTAQRKKIKRNNITWI